MARLIETLNAGNAESETIALSKGEFSFSATGFSVPSTVELFRRTAALPGVAGDPAGPFRSVGTFVSDTEIAVSNPADGNEWRAEITDEQGDAIVIRIEQ